MADLVVGRQYGICSQKKKNYNKSVIFVKLTDSALQSIENYVRHKGEPSAKLRIEFQHNNGVITLTTSGDNLTYNFTLSDVETNGLYSSFECLQQTDNSSFESLGCMLMKMHIHGNEESYAKIRNDLAASEEENRKNWTKEIKQDVSHTGRNFKRRGQVVSSIKVIPPNVSKSISKNKFGNNAELLKQQIRDRIIHILALRPYKRPEILLRLISEGISEEDRKAFATILPEVGTLKGNSLYTLSSILWNEVKADWKFYSREESEIIQKRKQQFLNGNSQLECFSLQKQIVCSPLTNELQSYAKKRRISHYNHAGNYNILDEIIKPPILTKEKSKQEIMKVNSQLECSTFQKQIVSMPPLNGLKPYAKKQKISHYKYTENHNILGNCCNPPVLTNSKGRDHKSRKLLPNGKIRVHAKKKNKRKKEKERRIKRRKEKEMKLGKKNRIRLQQNQNKFVPATNVLEPLMKETETSKDDRCNLYNGSLISAQVNENCLSENLPISPPSALSPTCMKKNCKTKRKTKRKQKFSIPQNQMKFVPATNVLEPLTKERKTSYERHCNIHIPAELNGNDKSENLHILPPISVTPVCVNKILPLTESKIMADECSPVQNEIKFISATKDLEPRTKERKTSNEGHCNLYIGPPVLASLNGHCLSEDSPKSPPVAVTPVCMNKISALTESKIKTDICSPAQTCTEPTPLLNNPELNTEELRAFHFPHSENSSGVSSCSGQTNDKYYDENASTSSSKDDCPEYIKEYGLIESSQQRDQYIADYNIQYEAYMRLYSEIKCWSERLTSFADNLHKFEEGSKKFIEYKTKIYEMCKVYQQNQNYMDALKKFNHLHFKLAHIKKLVMKYDSVF